MIMINYGIKPLNTGLSECDDYLGILYLRQSLRAMHTQVKGPLLDIQPLSYDFQQ